MTLPETAVPRKRNRPLFVRRLFDGSDDSLVFDQSVGKIYHVDGPTRLVWNLIDGRRTCGDIRKALSQPETESGRKAVSGEEVEECLQALMDLNWIECEPALVSIASSQ